MQANTNKCQVFRLRNTVPDAPGFKHRLLECMLNGICSFEGDTVHTFNKKVRHAIRWECDDILRDLLKKTHLKTEDKKDVLKLALVEAIARDNVPAVKALFEDTNVSVDQFDVGLRLHKKRDVLDLALDVDKTDNDELDELSKQFFDNAAMWNQLLVSIKASPHW
jgi:hypothetical protein